ncbi:AbiEi antitoxin N-terminal domain-containing protein [Paraburkholderia xenovorans]|uniref:Transcriptional regulator AbiEi antitoxin N-terminal domain-containing protein n=2 Tax=Paraburkholderia xenovorans TaxID=36873 RepID=Q13JC3_PARXL|nr:AbiEi antitoxin N-terminal domain-containing protein [Paraburkholderia xenovorans]ABE35816.1 hypothetical protein Bxe_B0119 [Paraburkholderia xenovorans LB400]
MLRGCGRGHPIDSALLREMGISNALAAYMVKAGWLRRLSQGVYLLTGDTPSRDGTITYLTRCVDKHAKLTRRAADWLDPTVESRWDDVDNARPLYGGFE